MKKRFTVMIEQKVIDKIKQLNGYWTPTTVRKAIEETLEQWADYQIDQLIATDWNRII